LEPTSHVSLLLYEGRELDIVTQAEALDHFKVIREDLDRLARATTMLEAVDQVAQERQPSTRLYQMLVGALRALAANNAPLLLPAFFLKLLALEGFQPILDGCASCGAPGPLVAFDVVVGGSLCPACARGPRVSEQAIELMHRILDGGLAGVLNEPVTPATAEVANLATRAMEHHLERRLRSVTVLD
jgi:DNA repair protein RecO (recombination protein O)